MSLRRIAAMVLGAAAAASIGICVWIQSHVDREAPELMIGSVLQGVTADVTDKDLLVDVTAKDKRDGDLTDQVMVAERTLGEEEMEVVYAVTDAAGNVALKRRAIPLTEKMMFAEGTEKEEETDRETEEAETETSTEESIETSTEESTEESSETESTEEETVESQELQTDETEEQESVSEANEPKETREQETEGYVAEETTEESTEETEPVETADPAIPVIRLKQNSVTLPAGTPFDYMSYIESITDDKDSRSTLNQYIVVTGYYDVRTPGSYPLQFWVTDTERHESERQEFLLIIE